MDNKDIVRDSAPRLDLTLAVSSFYAIKAIEASPKLYQADLFLRSQEAFVQDFTRYSKEFEEKLARTLFDYLSLAAFGEARHSHHHAIKNTVLSRSDGTVNMRPRTEIYPEATEHNPKVFLPYLVKLFRNKNAFNKSNSGTGGELWAKIAEAALMYFTFPPSVFIDHAVDLSHNGGLCFDKPTLVIMTGGEELYQPILDRKASSEVYNEGPLDSQTAEIVNRAQQLGFCKFKDTSAYYLYLDDRTLRFPHPIQWGRKSIYRRARKAVTNIGKVVENVENKKAA